MISVCITTTSVVIFEAARRTVSEVVEVEVLHPRVGLKEVAAGRRQ